MESDPVPDALHFQSAMEWLAGTGRYWQGTSHRRLPHDIVPEFVGVRPAAEGGPVVTYALRPAAKGTHDSEGGAFCPCLCKSWVASDGFGHDGGREYPPWSVLDATHVPLVLVAGRRLRSPVTSYEPHDDSYERTLEPVVVRFSADFYSCSEHPRVTTSMARNPRRSQQAVAQTLYPWRDEVEPSRDYWDRMAEEDRAEAYRKANLPLPGPARAKEGAQDPPAVFPFPISPAPSSLGIAAPFFSSPFAVF